MSTTDLLPAAGAARKTRQRLHPDARIAQILDAALEEFSVHGFEATRVDAIAHRAGLSKGGLYAHFDSKEEILGALMHRALVGPVLDMRMALERTLARTSGGWLPELIDAFYARLHDRGTLATIHLVLAEGHRMPEPLARWRRDALEGLLTEVGTLLRDAAARGWCKDSVVSHHPWLILAPLVYTIVHQLVDPGGETDPPLDAARTLHVQMLRELLDPTLQPPAAPAAPA